MQKNRKKEVSRGFDESVRAFWVMLLRAICRGGIQLFFEPHVEMWIYCVVIFLFPKVLTGLGENYLGRYLVIWPVSLGLWMQFSMDSRIQLWYYACKFSLQFFPPKTQTNTFPFINSFLIFFLSNISDIPIHSFWNSSSKNKLFTYDRRWVNSLRPTV